MEVDKHAGANVFADRDWSLPQATGAGEDPVCLILLDPDLVLPRLLTDAPNEFQTLLDHFLYCRAKARHLATSQERPEVLGQNGDRDPNPTARDHEP